MSWKIQLALGIGMVIAVVVVWLWWGILDQPFYRESCASDEAALKDIDVEGKAFK